MRSGRWSAVTTENLRLLRMIDVIVSEMAKGNFSFAILVVGIMQLIVMWRANR